MLNTLTFDTLQRKAPSIFSENSAERTSTKYQHISTLKVIEGLMNEGFVPTWADQSQSRLVSKKAYAKHMIRFRRLDARANEHQLFPEIVLINSHDGLSSYRLLAGVYRIVCSNGLVAGHSYDEIRVRHQGNIMRDVIEGTYTVIDNAHKMMDAANQMTAIELNADEKHYLAESAHMLRFEDNNELAEAVKPERLLAPRRREDANRNDLFTVFNVIVNNN